MPTYQPTTFILDEDDCTEDPFKDKRASMRTGPGEVPSMSYTQPGMTVTTIEVPAMGEAKLMHNFLHQLQTASGMIVTRPLGQTQWDKDVYLYHQDMWAEIAEVTDSRSLFHVNISKAGIRSMIVTLAAMSDISLATPDATFGLPEVRLGGTPAVTSVVLRKRLSDEAVRKMLTTGETIDAREAQRIGLVDFVGDVETELARLIFRNCQPQKTTVMYKPDVEKAWAAMA
jgi:hypothetical protein